MGDPNQPSTFVQRPTHVRWRIVALLMVCVALGHFNRISMSVAGTEHLMSEYSIPKPWMGWVYSAFLISYTVCMTPGGWFIDRVGPRTALMVVFFGSAVFAALTGLTGLVFTSAGLLVLMLIAVRTPMGVLNAPLHPGAARAVHSWLPPARWTGANGLVVSAACLGMAAAYQLFGPMMEWLHWQGAFLTAALATAILGLVWTFYATDRPEQHPAVNEPERRLIEGEPLRLPTMDDSKSGSAAVASSQTGSGLRDLLRDRSLICLTLSYGAVSYFQYLFFYWIEHYFKEVLGFNDHEARNGAAALVLAMGAGMIGGGWLADRVQRRFGPRRLRALVPVTGMIVSAVALVAGVLSPEHDVTIACFALAMAALGTSEGSFWSTAINLGGTRGATAAGILNTGGNGGGLLAPVITPYFSEYFGWQAGISLASVVCLSGAALWWWIEPRGETVERVES